MGKGVFKFSIRDICEIAVLVAIAIILDSFVKIQIGKSGGSLNISMIPIFIICLRHGWFKGLISGGFVYGLITCLIDGYGLQTYPLEYLVGFGSVCILGIFAKYINENFKMDNMQGLIISISMIIGSIALWSVIRFFAGSIDSVLLYKYDWAAAFSYNATYIFPSAGLDAFLLILLMPNVLRLNKSYETSYLED